MQPTDLTTTLAKLVRQMQTLNHQFLDHLGLGPGQASILRMISDHYGITETELSRLMKLDKSTVSRSVKRLVEAGYVRKSPDHTDRRSHHLLATRMASALKPLFEEVDQSVAKAVLEGFKEDQSKEFAEYLRRASANVDHVLHSPPESRFKLFLSRIQF